MSRESPRWRRRVLRLLMVLGLLLLAFVVAGASYLWSLPVVGDAPARVTRILSEHQAPADPMPPPRRLGEAVVAVEDEHFYSNVVFNTFDGAARAGIATLRRRGDPGGSTIAQQLAKQLWPQAPGLSATLQEIGLGVKLSVAFSKPRILSMYLNAVYYGHGYYGDTAAAKGYFGVPPDRLSWAEASLLAGLLQAPSDYDPFEHLALAKERQRHVLSQLVVNHDLTPAEAAAAYAARLPLRGGSPG
ncbi:MAG: biosynthetic peptidoglycan transglycosylase [Acidimicrobiales bacterium]